MHILLASAFFLARVPLFSSRLTKLLELIGSYWLGFFVYSLLLFAISDIVFLLIKVIKTPPLKYALVQGWIVIVAVCALLIYGTYNANRIKYVSYHIQVEKETSLESLKIVTIGDLHLGQNNERNLAKIVRGINGLEPDIVCIVGDVFNDNYNVIENPSEAIGLFKSIISTYGVYACVGNHDVGSTFGDMMDFLEQSNIKVLNDEYVVIDNQFVLIGRIDSSPIGSQSGLQRGEFSEILGEIDESMPVIIMDHNPSNIDQYGSEVNLILCGHTHKGQIFPGNLITNAMYTVDYGYYRQDADSPQVVVTSGVGTWGAPLRIGTNSEIVSVLIDFGLRE
jgi:predicted MPP superfamily phosphohydrolase